MFLAAIPKSFNINEIGHLDVEAARAYGKLLRRQTMGRQEELEKTIEKIVRKVLKQIATEQKAARGTAGQIKKK